MTDRVTVNRDRTALLPPNSPQKGYRITREEAAALGLVDSLEKPIQQRRPAFDASKAKVPPLQRRRDGTDPELLRTRRESLLTPKPKKRKKA